MRPGTATISQPVACLSLFDTFEKFGISLAASRSAIAAIHSGQA